MVQPPRKGDGALGFAAARRRRRRAGTGRGRTRRARRRRGPIRRPSAGAIARRRESRAAVKCSFAASSSPRLVSVPAIAWWASQREASSTLDASACVDTCSGGLHVAEDEVHGPQPPQPAHRRLAHPERCAKRHDAFEVRLDLRRRVSACRGERGRHGAADGQLAFVAVARGRQCANQRKRVREATNGLLGRGHTRCDLGGALEERDRPERLSASIEMHGDRGAHARRDRARTTARAPGRCGDESAAGAPAPAPRRPLPGCGRG